MAHERASLDITHNPDLLRLAEEVHSTNTPTILRRDDEGLAILMPVGEGSGRNGAAISEQEEPGEVAVGY